MLLVQEFCRIAIESVKRGANNKIYNNAAQKLGVEPEAVKNGIKSIIYLFCESAKLLLNDIDFHDSLMTLGIKDDINEILLDCYKANSVELRQLMSETSLTFPNYRDLHWRLDIQLATRSLRHQIEPIVTMSMKIASGDKIAEEIAMQTDPVNLIHMTRVLEQSLQEIKSQHCRRIINHIK